MTKDELKLLIKQLVQESTESTSNTLNQFISKESFSKFVNEVKTHNIPLTETQLIQIANSIYTTYYEKSFDLTDNIDLEDYFDSEYGNFIPTEFEDKVLNEISDILEDDTVFKKELETLGIVFDDEENGWSDNRYNLQVALQQLDFECDWDALDEHLREIAAENKAYEEDERWFARGGHRGYI